MTAASPNPAGWSRTARAKHRHYLSVFPTGEAKDLRRLERQLAAMVPLLCDAIDAPTKPNDGEHVHHYRILATGVPGDSGTVVAFERFLTADPTYGFRCSCGDVQTVTLVMAAERGWIDVLELAADTSWIKTEER